MQRKRTVGENGYSSKSRFYGFEPADLAEYAEHRVEQYIGQPGKEAKLLLDAWEHVRRLNEPPLVPETKAEKSTE